MINRVVLVGRTTRDIEVKKTQSGLSVATFTLACDRRKDAQGNNAADFISCIAWRQSADFLGQYARKGSLIGVDGRIQTRTYDDRDGRKVYVTEVVADTVRVFDRKEESNQSTTSNPYLDPAGFDMGTGEISPDDLPF